LDGAAGAETRASSMYAKSAALRGRDIMGTVSIVYKVMPKGIDVDLQTLKNALLEQVGGIAAVQNIEEKPIAFGLKALMVHIHVEDKGGIADRLENTIAGLPGVESVGVESVTLI